MDPSKFILAVVIGKEYDVVRDVGGGDTKRETGTVLSLDEQGYLVLEVDGKKVLIPKERVVIIEEHKTPA